jgi:hypothetical protein
MGRLGVVPGTVGLLGMIQSVLIPVLAEGMYVLLFHELLVHSGDRWLQVQ